MKTDQDGNTEAREHQRLSATASTMWQHFSVCKHDSPVCNSTNHTFWNPQWMFESADRIKYPVLA